MQITTIAGARPNFKSIFKYFWFIIWPFPSLIKNLFRYKNSGAENVLWLFIIFYAFTMVIPSEGSDANSYKLQFIEMAKTNISLSGFSSNFYLGEGSYVDIAIPFLSFLVSRVTDNYRFFFAAAGALIGFFYSRNIFFILKNVKGGLNVYLRLLVLTFAIVIPFWNMGNFRFVAASHLFIFSVLPFLFHTKNKRIWISFLAPLVHFSFIVPVIVLIIYRIVGNRTNLYFIIFLISLPITQVNLGLVGGFLESIVPQAFIWKVESYTSVEYAQNVADLNQSAHTFFTLNIKLFRWAIFILSITLYFKWKSQIKHHKGLNSIFNYSLLALGMGNLFSLVPSGFRFLDLPIVFMLATLFFYTSIGFKNNYIKYLRPIIFVAFIFYLAVSIRLGLESMSIELLVGNPLITYLFDDPISIWGIID